MLSTVAIHEFKQIWIEEFGEDLPDNLAMEEALELLMLINAVYKPIKSIWLNEYENEHALQKTNLKE